MNHVIHNSIVNFIWGIADDVLRDLYVRGKYRDLILPSMMKRRSSWQAASFRNLMIGRREVQLLEGNPSGPEPWPVAIIAVLRSNNLAIVRI